jgi:hypothetical protein
MSTSDEQRRRARRLALALGLLAILIYGAFIFFSIRRSRG